MFVFASPYSCYKPTPQEDYAHAKHCYVALDRVLKRIPAAELKRAGLDRDTVETADDDYLGATWQHGRALGMSTNAISSDIERAQMSYLKGRSAAQRRSALRDDANGCLGDYYGRPND
jgi:hypothetical protein